MYTPGIHDVRTVYIRHPSMVQIKAAPQSSSENSAFNSQCGASLPAPLNWPDLTRFLSNQNR